MHIGVHQNGPFVGIVEHETIARAAREDVLALYYCPPHTYDLEIDKPSLECTNVI